MKTSEELLAKAFADSPADASRIIFRVRPSPVKRNSKDLNGGGADENDDYDSQEESVLHSIKPSNWMEYAKLLEKSGKIFP